jgi:hypothetical protein
MVTASFSSPPWPSENYFRTWKNELVWQSYSSVVERVYVYNDTTNPPSALVYPLENNLLNVIPSFFRSQSDELKRYKAVLSDMVYTDNTYLVASVLTDQPSGWLDPEIMEDYSAYLAAPTKQIWTWTGSSWELRDWMYPSLDRKRVCELAGVPILTNAAYVYTNFYGWEYGDTNTYSSVQNGIKTNYTTWFDYTPIRNVGGTNTWGWRMFREVVSQYCWRKDDSSLYADYSYYLLDKHCDLTNSVESTNYYAVLNSQGVDDYDIQDYREGSWTFSEEITVEGAETNYYCTSTWTCASSTYFQPGASCRGEPHYNTYNSSGYVESHTYWDTIYHVFESGNGRDGTAYLYWKFTHGATGTIVNVKYLTYELDASNYVCNAVISNQEVYFSFNNNYSAFPTGMTYAASASVSGGSFSNSFSPPSTGLGAMNGPPDDTENCAWGWTEELATGDTVSVSFSIQHTYKYQQLQWSVGFADSELFIHYDFEYVE